MNPPSALFGAMNKERKPFTYTPGGLDLSEIKSERMAQRLIRNAMSEGVPETPVQSIQSPPPQYNASVLPNFNCLPVQVFPTFALPANPKSLLRSRSNPDPPRELPKNKASVPLLLISEDKPSNNERRNIKPSLFSLDNSSVWINDDQNASIKSSPSLVNSGGLATSGYTEITLPEKRYDAEYFVMEPQGNIQSLEKNINELESNGQTYQNNNNLPISGIFVDTYGSTEKNLDVLTSTLPEENTTNDFEQKKVKVVKKQTNTSENEVEQNGDTEAAVVVKLPTKKSSAKTEVKVEVSKKTLADGSIEEVKKTITKTTIDGKTEIKTETETQVIPKDEEEFVEIEEQEEETEEGVVEEVGNDPNNEDIVEKTNDVKNIESSDEKLAKNEEDSNKTEIKENGHIVSGEEKIEISTTKKVVVTQSTDHENEEDQEEQAEEQIEDGDVEVEQVIVLKKVEDKETEESDDVENMKYTTNNSGDEEEIEEVEEEEEEEEIADEENVDDSQENLEKEENNKDTAESEKDEEVETEDVEAEEEQIEEEEEDVIKDGEEENKEESQETEINEEKEKSGEDVQEEYTEAEDVPLISDTKTAVTDNTTTTEVETPTKEVETTTTEGSEETKPTNESSEKAAIEVEPQPSVPNEETTKQKSEEQVLKITIETEPRLSFSTMSEPSVPLEKVEDVEIKPIGPAQEVIKKCHTEIITTTKDEPTGALSTQTNYNRIENIVTVNRTTKILDHSYEPVETSIPSIYPYYVPPNVCPPERILSTPQPISKSYQPTYTSEPQTERRHSLLLDRLSVDRQIPVQQSDIYHNNYQYTNQNYEQNQWLQEPQSEVLTVSNVKPSTISKNQQWYQQSKREENYTTDNIVTPTPIMPSQLSQTQFQPKPQVKLQPQSQPQPQTQPQPQPQAQPQIQPQFQPQYQNHIQPQYTHKPEFQPAYTDNIKQNSFKSSSANFQQNSYPNYTPKPSWVSSTVDAKPTAASQYNPYSTLRKESTENYQTTSQPFSSSYVPPPWEQDSSYVLDNQNFYQPPLTTTYIPSTTNTNQSWKPKEPKGKFSKPPPTAYIPPAPNQSFVKPVSSADAQSMPGRKTYYSEYERRYISVPETTYIPSETKFQPQPDPSPQYYFDNNEPTESVEPQWRKELREFTEKTSLTTTTQTENTSVKPPWVEDPKYATGYNTYITKTVTPSWTQTLRPRSWRETSYESEYTGSKEWPKTNSLGRGRPHSSYVRNVDTVRERTRGVSVDRYNPNSYQSPISSEHPPVQSVTLNANIPKTYHNPTVPAYHARTSAEPREQSAPHKQRTWYESKAPPVQSRSFKYLQWITGTED